MKTKFNFTLSGFIIALLVVTMFMIAFTQFYVDLETDYNVTGNNIFSNYNNSDALRDKVLEIRENTKLNQDDSVLDVIGGYFRAGYGALQITGESVNLYQDILEQAESDEGGQLGFSLYGSLIFLMVLIGLFVGVIITVLVKMRI